MKSLSSCAWLLMLLSGIQLNGQPCKTEIKVVGTRAALRQSVEQHSAMAFVKLRSLIPGLVTDLRYGTTNNFTGTKLYSNPDAYMRKLPAEALKQVQDELAKQHLGIKIFDAYRPFSVTCILWQRASNKRYVANPRRGSHHNRGLAVDLTLIDLRTGRELDMGTGFDNFTDSAHHSFTNLPPEVIKNRKTLKHIMWKYGFNYVPTEWWHYHWRDKNYDVVDLGFDSLE
jgi:zinc D-Ala-D-Ala dipeptidase